MHLDPSMPIGTVAARHPFSVKLFEDAGIDYHLGGSSSLRDACASQNVSLELMLGKLQLGLARQRDVDVDWTTESLTELVGHILHGHHAYTRAVCARALGHLDEAIEHHRTWNWVKHVQRTFQIFARDLVSHLDVEESSIFPYVVGLDRHVVLRVPYSTVEIPARIMSFDHESQEDGLARLRDVTDDYTSAPKSCAQLRSAVADMAALQRDLHEHLHLENNVLFPRAAELEKKL